MIIDAQDARTLRIETPYHPEIVDRIKSLREREYDKARRCWYVPAKLFDEVMEKFPLASVTYDAVAAACDAEAQRAGHFVDGLRCFGLSVRLNDDDVVTVEGNVSPVIQEAVALRADALRRLLRVEPERGIAKGRAKYPLNAGRNIRPISPAVEPTDFDRLFFNGIQNAAKREQRKQQRGAMQRRKRGKAKPVQGTLFSV